MRMTVRNEKIHVEGIEVAEVVRSSIVLIGDAEEITCSTIFDTPADSLVFSPEIPLVTGKRSTASRGQEKQAAPSAEK